MGTCLLGLVAGTGGQVGDLHDRRPISENREIRAIHAAQIATAAFFSSYDMWGMITL